MSVLIMSQVWDLQLPDSEKLVLLALADAANDEGLCWPSIATLARKCTRSERTVQSVIKRLVDGGYISRDERPGRGVMYTIHPRSDCTPATAAPPQRLRPRNGCTPATTAPHPRSDCTPPPQPLHPNHHRTVTEPSVDDGAREGAPVEGEVIPASAVELADYCARLAGIANVSPAAITRNVDTVSGWLQAGCDPGLDIIPTIQRLTGASPEAIHSLRYFEKEVRHAQAKRTAAAGLREPDVGHRPDQKPSRLETAAAARDRAIAILRDRQAARRARADTGGA